MTVAYKTGRFVVRNGAPATTVAVVAAAALQHWQWAVRGVPAVATDEAARSALRHLSDWYFRICVDDRYDKAPPPDGLEAVAALENGQEVDQRRVVFTYWSVLVAQELATCRRCERDGDDQSSVLARTRLDLALQSAFERLS